MALAEEITRALKSKDVILSAEPGAGKSTGLPLAFLFDSTITGKIILLEPRRLAARSVASRLSAHLNEEIGQRIGLRMRLETRVSAQTRLTVVTEGVLTRMLQKDPSLDGVSLIIFDEFHERSLHADLGLALCLEVKQALREDLRLLLMSATLDTEQINHHISNLEHFHCPVRQHAVTTIWEGSQSAPLAQRVVKATLNAIQDHTGDILIFLPGVAEINKISQALQPRLSENIELHHLHGNIGLKDQLEATAPAKEGKRRVILSTSLAETSITIDGVKIVIDSGLERRAKIDTSTGAQRLETVPSSQASATQRSGRAGRTAPGVCYRLWPESGHARRPRQWQPEIYRADLAPLLLDIGLWGAANVSDLPWLDAPPTAAISRAKDLMSRLGLSSNDKLTENGRTVATLPVHPRLGHMMVWAVKHNSLDMAATITALIEDQPRSTRQIDLGLTINQAQTKTIRQRATTLTRMLDKHHLNVGTPSAALLLAQAFPDWIAQRRPGEPGRFQLACGAGVIIDEESELAQCQWLVVVQLGGNSTQLRIFRAIELSISELEDDSPGFFTDTVLLDWDDKNQRIRAEERKMIGHLIVDTRPYHDLNSLEKAQALLTGIARNGMDCLPWTDDCREWQARVNRMHSISTVKLSTPWPSVEDSSLADSLENWLLPWIDGISSIKALQQINLFNVLNAMLDYQQQSLLDQYLPTRYTVPSGSKIRLSYVKPGNPVLSVRLQEMLGCRENPTVAQGQTIIKIELLSPAHRPVQVTTDLVNFWNSSYPAVKKEMAGRYPKHLWPDDPLNAQPTTRAKPRKT